jgi:hypothetical protein
MSLTLKQAFLGLTKNASTGYIAEQLRKGAGSWDVYARISSREFRGKLMFIWNSRYSAAGGDSWCYACVNADGTVTLTDTYGRSEVVTPAPGCLSEIKP